MPLSCPLAHPFLETGQEEEAGGGLQSSPAVLDATTMQGAAS